VQFDERADPAEQVVVGLPLTLAVLDGMSVSVGEETFIVPLNAVAESLQPRQEDIKSIAGQGRFRTR